MKLCISNSQLGFHKGSAKCEAIFFTLKKIIENHESQFTIFIELATAHGHIPREFLFLVLTNNNKTSRIDAHVITTLLEKIYEHTTAYISVTKAKFDIVNRLPSRQSRKSNIF